jgi:hypothetical protein
MFRQRHFYRYVPACIRFSFNQDINVSVIANTSDQHLSNIYVERCWKEISWKIKQVGEDSFYNLSQNVAGLIPD